MLIQFVDFSVLLFDFRSVFFDASLRVEERLLDESGIGLLHVWETLDTEVLHDLFDLLLQVEHFGLEFCSLRRFWREREGARVGARVSSSVHYCRRFAGVQWNWKRERGHNEKRRRKEDARWTRVSSSRRRFARQSSLNPRTTWRFSSRSRFGRKWLLFWWSRRQENRDTRAVF